MDDKPVIKALQEYVHHFQSQRLAASHIIKPDGLPMTPQYLSDLLSGKRSIPEWLGRRFDFEPRWVKVKK